MDNGAPKSLHVVVRWGKSVLVNRDLRRVPARFDVVQDRAWLESRRGAVELVTEDGRERIERGALVRRQVGELTIVIDAQEAEVAAFGARPMVEGRFAASDALSIALHAAILIGLVIWRAPLAETEQVPLTSIDSEPPMMLSIGPATPLGPGDEHADIGQLDDYVVVGSASWTTPVRRVSRRRRAHQARDDRRVRRRGCLTATSGARRMTPGRRGRPRWKMRARSAWPASSRTRTQ
ncbi:MAG: hypothetical protein HOV80_37185 [Polyangiaceae bacterium]|nr:hypothetical protein [Polyangiaceae bacterium]